MGLGEEQKGPAEGAQEDAGFPWQPSAAWAGTTQKLREETSVGGRGREGGTARVWSHCPAFCLFHRCWDRQMDVAEDSTEGGSSCSLPQASPDPRVAGDGRGVISTS